MPKTLETIVCTMALIAMPFVIIGGAILLAEHENARRGPTEVPPKIYNVMTGLYGQDIRYKQLIDKAVADDVVTHYEWWEISDLMHEIEAAVAHQQLLAKTKSQ